MKTIDDLDVSGRRVLVRADLNVPLDDGQITDDGKIRACLPTLSALLDRGAAIVVCSHLGRPGGLRDPAYSLAPVAVRLGDLLGRLVRPAADTVGPAAARRRAPRAVGDGRAAAADREHPAPDGKDNLLERPDGRL
jgi:phosphoglycerate kinase